MPLTFNSAEQATSVLWGFTKRLLRLVMWLYLAVAHLLLLWLVAVLAWWFQLTPAGLSTAVAQMAQSTTAAVLGIAGLSAAGALSAWVWLCRKLLESATKGPVLDYLLQDAAPRE